MDKIKPFGNNILIEPIERKQVLVSDTTSKCEYGKVIAIGDDVKNIKIGDSVGFLVWGINGLKVGDSTYYFLPEDPQFLLGTLDESLLLE